MDLSNSSVAVAFPWILRVALTVAGVGLLALLATAAMLTPDPNGLGTHQQLGLPPCTFTQQTGVRCPSCGMTTAWSHMTRGHVAKSFQSNVGGALLAVLAAVTGPWLLASGLCGRWVVARPDHRLLLSALVAVIVITLADWIVRLAV